jgi:transposase
MSAVETVAREITAAQRTGVEELLRQRELSPRQRERLEMVKAAALGQDRRTIMAWSGRTARTVERWLRRFVAEGPAALRDAPRAGRPSRADVAYRQALETAVSTPPRTLGLGFDVWTSARLSAYMAETRGVRLAPGWVRVLLAQQDFVCGRPKHSLKHLQDPTEVAACQAELAAVAAKVAAAPDRYELHHQDETHLETNPYLARVWHRRGQQPTVPAVGTNRRVTTFGSVEVGGRGRVEVVCGTQTSAAFLLYLQALDTRHAATGREIYVALDHGPCHTSKTSRAALAARAAWLHVLWLARYSPELNKKEREWRVLKRDTRGHLARSLRAFVDEILAGLRALGGTLVEVVDQVPDWFLAGHRRPPTGRAAGRPKGAKDSYKRAPYQTKRTNLPAVA